ncbi:ABC transporter permease [Wolbachia endosymbiont of Brugia malayi]|uniref:MlaE family ABC transporter permease n=1 Tax=Wolbachia endosymbiont of Brugia malayi TaxID=80849 RepID=UPI00004C9475|nr:ABC transporter permease [Wolbachia endosymbiont of Brugia malayi]AAW71205.1 ABC-type transport system involved in resistance to organic solvents, permease component [Wolbachia endosymbiont strain TRS of Brugia malayi]QCB61401.1 ABC transporter permease [Wolbachia endosymbiont of Brugia malayi]
MSSFDINGIRIIGRCFIKLLLRLGSAFIFFIQSLYHCFVPPYYLGNIAKQIIEIGFFSLPIVGLTGIFIGAVIVLQSSLSGPLISPEQIIPKLVTVTIIKELGPVLISLIMVGKVGSSIAAEIGTMRITEQIDALTTLNINPFKYLIAPRILASVIVFPIFTICADLIGIFGGYITAVFKFNHNLNIYIKYTTQFFNMYNFITGLIKATAFGAIISVSSCYYGYHCQEGARGVSIATTSTVVLSSILIILANYMITLIHA